MKRILITLAALVCSLSAFGQAAQDGIEVRHLAHEQNILTVKAESRYLLLPVEDNAPEAKLYIISDGRRVSDVEMNVRLAREKAEYYVPLDLSAFAGKEILIDVQGMPALCSCWSEFRLSDEFSEENTEYWRPAYHHTPKYGWMNDPNGMFFKDGVYHLCYQHNPYGSTWGNMHWRHSSSTDLMNWKDEGIAISPDALGTVFSGSCVVDNDNTAGFGAGAVIAFYTSAKSTKWGDCQSQSMAYSTDGGKTFTKYEGNPVITSGKADFRDPKVFWYAPGKHWNMILAAGQEMQIYSSPDLKEWTYESSFGKNLGAHGGVWECPDLVQLPVEGTDETKWMLICNINPGGPFGGSAAQYFTGDFDGKTFTCESPELTKWLDYGKDNYASVTWSGTEGRTIVLGWMSNWQYQVNLPIKQYRGLNTLPRELSLYERDGRTYVRTLPVPETESLRKSRTAKGSFSVGRNGAETKGFGGNESGACEINLTLRAGSPAQSIEFALLNSAGEEVVFTCDFAWDKFSMDKTRSGKTDFSSDFPAVTSAPMMADKDLNLRIFVDKTSIEVFGDDGKFVMTNLVFPTVPYDRIRFASKDGGSFTVKTLDIYEY